MQALLNVAVFVQITGSARGCNDPDDDAVIETAEVGAANYLITGDSDLLDDRIRANLMHGGIDVISAKDFLRGSLAAQPLGTAVVGHVQMIVGSEVASAITASRWQQENLRKGLETLTYELMVAAAKIKQRTALHNAELAELGSCGDNGAPIESRRAVLEVDIARTAKLLQIAYKSAVTAIAAAESATGKLSEVFRSVSP